MYNMEIYCTRPDCIENGFSIQYRLVQYTSILCIVLYNNLLILHEHRFKQVMNSIHFRYIRATSAIVFCTKKLSTLQLLVKMNEIRGKQTS